MSTVALRGILVHDETTKEWSWRGRWVFGDCVPVPVASVNAVGPEGVPEGSSPTTGTASAEGSAVVVAAAAAAARKSKGSNSNKNNNNNKSKDGSQPFLYKWKEAFAPSTIPVPSLNVKVIGAEENDDDDEDEDPEETTLVTSAEMETEPISPERAVVDNTTVRKTQPQEVVPSSAADDDSKSKNKSKDQPPVSVEKPTIERRGGGGQTDASKTTSPTTPTPTAPMGLKSPSNTTQDVTSNDAKNNDTKKDGLDEDKDRDKNTRIIGDSSTGSNAETNTTNTTTAAAEPDDPPPTSATSRNNEKNDELFSSVVQQQSGSSNSAPIDGPIDGTKKEEGKSSEISPMQVSTPTATTPTATPTTPTTTMVTTPSNEDKSSNTKVEAAPAKIMFASVMPTFSEALEKFKSNREKDDKITTLCPSSGKWKGYFENVVPGKKSGRNKTQQPSTIQKVDETFYLFLNATPSFSAEEDPEIKNDDPSVDLFAFETTTKDHIPKIKASPIPLEKNSAESKKEVFSLVQVRGCGENEFGTFEIMGYLNLNTMVMEIQRQYVVTEVKAASPRPSNRRRRSSPHSASSAAYEGPRPHSTRKRNPTWKRASYDPEEDRRRKRGRSLPGQKHGSPMAVDSAAWNSADGNGTAFAHPSSIPFTATSNQGQPSSTGLQGNPLSASTPMSTMSGGSISSSVTVGSAGRGSKSRLVLPTQSKAGSNLNSGARRRSTGSIGGGPRTKRRSSSMGKSTTGSASTKSGSTYIRLPSVGDAKKARWRAAHFLYYLRDDPEHRAQQQHQQQQQQQQPLQPGNTANSSGPNGTTANANKVAAPKPKYVIYEGEMVDSKREGRGICLFSDGTLYEGEWKRNKEHGYGKLMSSDRTKIIYEGEWERGRMQGNGTYYYGSSDPLDLGSRYIGEFRENLRNGMGRYFLPDKSVYDGQWRDGVMNGLGVFTWPDKSMYDGVWKDGKRNGQGLLKKADGFMYDGQWNNNTMDGRGSAIYPNGQRYEGSFSNGRREGRGTIVFTNGAVYEGRFRDDAVDGQGTMKMSRTMTVPREDKSPSGDTIMKKEDTKVDEDHGETGTQGEESRKEDFMIPISFQSDMTRILTKTGFM